MSLNLSDLLKQGLVRQFNATPEEVANALALAARDARTADELLESNSDWAFNIAYNAVLQAAKAWILHKGYRSATEAQHLAVLRFAEATLGTKFEKSVLFDRMRKKRHAATYDAPGAVSDYEARQAVDLAKEFTAFVKQKING